MSLTELRNLTTAEKAKKNISLVSILEKNQKSHSYIAQRYKDKTLDFYLPQTSELPYGVRVEESGPQGFSRSYRVSKQGKRAGLFIVGSIVEYDSQAWCHISFSRGDKMPNYEDMAWVKKHWIGDDRDAFQLFPKKENHVNIAEYCLHLWCPLDEFYLPDFRTNGGI